MIKDIKIRDKEKCAPESGFYVKLEWMFGIGEEYKTTIIGAFPPKFKYLYLEFLNVLQSMINEYTFGKLPSDDYDCVRGIKKFFNNEYYSKRYNLTSEESEIIRNLDIKIPCTQQGFIAELLNYTAYYYEKYPIELIEE